MTCQRALAGMDGVRIHTSGSNNGQEDKVDKVKENDLSLIEKYVCAAYDPHNRFDKITWIGCGSFYLQSRVKTNWESFFWQDALCNFIVCVQCTVLVGYGA